MAGLDSFDLVEKRLELLDRAVGTPYRGIRATGHGASAGMNSRVPDKMDILLSRHNEESSLYSCFILGEFVLNSTIEKTFINTKEAVIQNSI
ncbi:hypothetical protein Elgi_30930 [Paenibacillus elgii]|nr:hypothetical protein Elgi_30930 [Paenibacillus elgii]